MECNQPAPCGCRYAKKGKADWMAAVGGLQEVAKCKFSLLPSQSDIKEPNKLLDVNTVPAAVDAMLRKIIGLW